MAKHRATFGKLQRERDKKAKAAAKRERRITRGDEDGPSDDPVVHEHDEAKVLAALESLHRAYDEGTISIDDFELKRDELTSRIRVT
ncbi:MAG: hypothetical protein ACRD12_09775 [Acidimicrobiales bacterium]